METKSRMLKRNPEPVKTVSRPAVTVTQPKSEPAKPEPTTIISKLRLFAGFTKATVERYLLHFCSKLPSGILLSNFDIS